MYLASSQEGYITKGYLFFFSLILDFDYKVENSLLEKFTCQNKTKQNKWFKKKSDKIIK